MTIKENPKSRNARIRKKLRVDEYQELGFEISWRFNPDLDNKAMDEIIDDFIQEVIDPYELGFAGDGDHQWNGLICTQKVGKCTQDHRNAVQAFFADKPISELNVSELLDLWWD